MMDKTAYLDNRRGLAVGDSVHKDEMCRQTDEQLAAQVRQGVQSAFAELTSRYLPFIKSKASAYRKMGLEPEDMMQEGLLGLLRAAETFQSGGEAAFQTYAGLCIERRLITAYRSAARKKHLPLNDYLSLSGGEEGALCSTVVSDEAGDPEALLIEKEGFHRFRQRVQQQLSPFEYQTLSLYLCGLTYEEIGKKLQTSAKSVDNALQRIRRKLKKSFHVR